MNCVTRCRPARSVLNEIVNRRLTRGPVARFDDCVGRTDMDGLTLVVLLALASTLALAGARAVLGAVLHLMTATLVTAPVQPHQNPTRGA